MVYGGLVDGGDDNYPVHGALGMTEGNGAFVYLPKADHFNPAFPQIIPRPPRKLRNW